MALKQKFVVQFSSNIVIKLLGMIAGIFVARFAGPEVVGTIAYGAAYVAIFNFITGIFGTPHLKLVSEGQPQGDCVAVYSILQFTSIGVYFVIVSLWFFVQKQILHYRFESNTHEVVIWLSLLVAIASNILTLTQITYIARMKQAKANLPQLLHDILYQIGRITLVLLGFKAIALVSWNLVSFILVLPLGIYYFKKLPWGKWRKNIQKEYIKISIPIFCIVIINSITAYSGQLVLQHYSNSEELGYYSAAFSVGGMIILFGNTAGTIFFPLFSSLIANKDWNSISEKIGHYQDFIAIFIFPFICALALVGELFLTTLLGEKYTSSVVPFIILLFASYIVIAGMPYGNIISGMGRFSLNAVINFVILCLYLVSIILFISPTFLNLGATGLALNVLTVNMVNNIVYLFIAKRIGSLQSHTQNIYRYLVIILSAITSWFLISMMNIDHPFWRIISVISCLILTYFIMFKFKLIEKKHLQQFLEIINIKKTVSYAIDEIQN